MKGKRATRIQASSRRDDCFHLPDYGVQPGGWAVWERISIRLSSALQLHKKTIGLGNSDI